MILREASSNARALGGRGAKGWSPLMIALAQGAWWDACPYIALMVQIGGLRLIIA